MTGGLGLGGRFVEQALYPLPTLGVHILPHKLSGPAQLASEPRFGYPPVAVNGCFRDTEQLRRLRYLQAAEVPALYHQRLARIQAGQLAESGVEGDNLILRGHRLMEGLIEGDQERVA